MKTMKTTKARKTRKTARKAGIASTAHLLQDNAGTALRRGRATLSRAYDWAHEAGSAHLGSLRLPRRTDIGHLTEANPLLLGAVGLGLGMAIGTLFPRGMVRRRPAVAVRTAGGNGSAAPVKAAARRRGKKVRSAASA
ncbi:hypothetical protein G5V57_29765 [Nordella sp. HKS 07]|uniref:hypothetical protein n=1 Tax=Nordella sp. HKS 07 TaxID=2712222 RepID=UPI0013E1E19B|nr:hypothetical protein [Nordella sp. HKS 07]QIG51533.1 hypothetical protein G5V57_29765 [Nordella sp. HKS 07]